MVSLSYVLSLIIFAITIYKKCNHYTSSKKKNLSSIFS